MIFSNRIWFAALAFVFLVAAYFIEGHRLASLGIMDGALQSHNELTRRSAELEIKGIRAISTVLALVFTVLALSWNRIEASPAYRRFTDAERRFPPGYERIIRTVANPSLWIMVLAMALALIYVASADNVLSSEGLNAMNREDGVIESGQAILLVLAGLLAAFAAIVGRGAGALRGMLAFLAFLYFLMVGEEISWGQRFIGFETPDAMQNLNVQNEFNMHNMFGYLTDHLFIAGFFLWGSLVPILNATSKTFNQLFRVVGLPVPSWGLAIAMVLVSILFQEQILYRLLSPLEGLRPPEMREFLSDICFLLLMVETYRGIRESQGAGTTVAA